MYVPFFLASDRRRCRAFSNSLPSRRPLAWYLGCAFFCSFGCFCFLLLQKKTVKKAAPAAAKPKKAAATKAKTPTKKAAAATGPKKVIAKKAKATTKSPKKVKSSK